MASLEKLFKSIEQIKITEGLSAEANVKKKELRVHILNLVEFNTNSNVQNHKDFVSSIGPSIDALVKLCDSKDSDIRLASDEGLCKVIKALLPLHSNRILVELCKQIKKNDSPRILKLSMNRFAELCHYARPQKRRAYLANLLNAISAIAERKEEMLHESLSNFVAKVFNVMGVFAFENETKTLLKGFLTNLSSNSSIIRRCAANAITTVISTNRKSGVLLALVVEYLTDQILLSDDTSVIDTPITAGTLLTLKLLLPLFQSTSMQAKENVPANQSNQLHKPDANLNAVAQERIVQIFELGVHYSFSSDHNVVNAALELLQQLLKMRSFLLAIPVLKCANGLQGTRISLKGLTKSNSQWNVAPLPIAEESHLFEADIPLGEFDKTSLESTESEAEATDEELTRTISSIDQLSRNRTLQESDLVGYDKELEETFPEPESANSSVGPQMIDIGSLYDKKGCSPLLYCARHLAYQFLLSEKKGELKSNRSVRVSVKSLAINCLAYAGSLEPLIWNSFLCDSDEGRIPITDVLKYSAHDDPQLRGQASLLACMILISRINGHNLTNVEATDLIRIVDETLKDKETAACRLALQGLHQFLPLAVESPYCVELVTLLRSLLTLSENPYWLVRVDLLEVFSSFSWTALAFGIRNQTNFSLPKYQESFFHKVILPMIGDEDHRVRTAVANCICCLVHSWSTYENPPIVCRLRRLTSAAYTPPEFSFQTVTGVSLPINGLAEVYQDSPVNQDILNNLKYLSDQVLQLLVSSSSKFVKMGCLQTLASLTSAYPPATYREIYDCTPNSSCTLLKVCLALMANTTLMLDLATHQNLLSIARQVFAGCVKGNLNDIPTNRDVGDWRFLNGPNAASASFFINHIARILNAFCCILEDINPVTAPVKAPLVTLPSPSALSPIRRKLKSGEGLVLEKEEKPEELGRKWSKPTQLLNPNNLGYFAAQPLYIKLYDLLKSTHSTCKLSFDTANSERFSGFIQSTLEALATLLEVSVFHDIGKHSEEILNYLRLIINIEPVSCLHNVQQLLKSLFGANLAAVWYDEVARLKRSSISPNSPKPAKVKTCCTSSWLIEDYLFQDAVGLMNFKRTNERPHLITKFRTSASKLVPDKTALSSYIRLFEPMVIRALKLYTVTSCPRVQKQVLDLLCELIHLCVNYCLLDADQVFLNFVIQQFEFLEEGFIPQVEILLPSMFRFLSLLSYDRFHSKVIISVPRIMQLAGGLMATGKDTQLHVLPTLRPMVEDLFLSKERMSDNFKELETQKEVLVNILLRLIQYHKVYPLMTAVLIQVQFENASKWKSLSKQICDAIVPCLNRHSLYLDSIEALQMLLKLISHLDPPIVHECLLGLLQTFAPQQLGDLECTATMDYHRVLACRLTVFETLFAVFDEAFLLDCLNEFNLSYLVNKRSDPLNVTPTENSPPEQILSSLLVDTLKLALSHWKSKVAAENSSPNLISWKTDDISFPVYLVLRLIDLGRRLSCLGDFPILQSAILDELNREECKYPLFRMASSLIPYNPLVFARICSLLSSKIHFVVNKDSVTINFGGLNGSIAQTGFFLVLCDSLPKEGIGFSEIVVAYSDRILQNFNEPSVKTMLKNLVKDGTCVEALLKNVLSTTDTSLTVSFALAYLNIIDSAHLVNMDEVIVKTISLFQSIRNALVHKKMCEVISKINFTSPEIKARFLAKITEIVVNSPNVRYYSDFTKSPSQEINPGEVVIVDKAFVLNSALKRDPTPLMWKNIIIQVGLDDLKELLRNQNCLSFVLGSGRKLNYEFFAYAKKVLFEQLSNIGEGDDMLSLELAVRSLCKNTAGSKFKDLFGASEIIELAKIPLMCLRKPTSLYRSLRLLKMSSDVIVMFDGDLANEWMDPSILPAVYKAIDTLENICIQVGSEMTFRHQTITGLDEIEHLDSNFVKSAQQLNRIFTFIEEQRDRLPMILNEDLLSTAIMFCRMPLYYSYMCIPPSIWSKNWNPTITFDKERLKLDLPIMPSHFLHDEIVMKEFVYRIEQISWISRQKFEEIWMTFLGILNLQSDDQVRPEEQASIIQATCEAVRAITMVLRKNLPFYDPSKITINREFEKPLHFMVTERGKKLQILFNLLEQEGTVGYCNPSYQFNCATFKYIQHNIGQGSPSKKKSSSPEEVTDIDIQSCVHFLVDLYSQWLQNSNTPYQLLVDLFRSLSTISSFFIDVQQFEWMLDSALCLYKQILPEDPACLESALVGCILKSASFINMNAEHWEQVKKVCEASLGSQHITTRANGLEGLMFLLQKFARYPDHSRAGFLVNLAMDYITKYLSPENAGPNWHQSWVWSIALYCGEYFSLLPYHNYTVVDFVIQCALNGIIESIPQTIRIRREILKGLERLCIIGELSPSWRAKVKIELLTLIRNVEKDWTLTPAIRALLSLVYSDVSSQLYKPGDDPETMLIAMEWVGALFQRMRRGTDAEADLLGHILPAITCDIFPPADILNRILSEFMTARPTVAFSLVPTVFKVFETARAQGQQSLVVEWILLSLTNFTRTPSDPSVDMSVWNMLCFFTAASRNSWLQSVFPLISHPVDQTDPFQVQVFVASAQDFNSQLNDQQRTSLTSIFQFAKEKSPLFATVYYALNHL